MPSLSSLGAQWSVNGCGTGGGEGAVFSHSTQLPSSPSSGFCGAPWSTASCSAWLPILDTALQILRNRVFSDGPDTVTWGQVRAGGLREDLPSGQLLKDSCPLQGRWPSFAHSVSSHFSKFNKHFAEEQNNWSHTCRLPDLFYMCMQYRVTENMFRPSASNHVRCCGGDQGRNSRHPQP